MTRSVIAAVAITVWLQTAADAAGPAQPPLVLGVGTATCEAWIAAAGAPDGTRRAEFAAWLFGYLTGAQRAAPEYRAELAKWSTARLLAEMDERCREAPLETVHRQAAAVELKLTVTEAFDRALRNAGPAEPPRRRSTPPR